MFHAGVINLLQFKEVFMEHDLKSALIIVAAVFAVLCHTELLRLLRLNLSLALLEDLSR